MFIQLELDFGPGSIVSKDFEFELMDAYFNFLERLGPSKRPAVPEERRIRCPDCQSIIWLA
jgi:hypothetical protein